ncbi:MAG: DUF1501 domain-containing protein [Bryobacteraceae bacterium]|nr:DUF1501 domain-containing protein [Bryobacteraceae bacterium]
MSQEKFDRLLRRFPHPHRWGFSRPHVSRRQFFEVGGLLGSYLMLHPQQAAAQVRVTSQNVTTINKAKNVIFILLTGAPSHVDTFDLKVTAGTTPTSFTPTMIDGVNWPTGLMPKIGARLGDLAIVRSMRSWALVHLLAQQWTQVGRNPAAALGDIAPNIGSLVALELEKQRTPSQIFPAFLALNAAGAAGPGYLPGSFAPFKVIPSATGLPNTTNSEGQTRANDMYSRLRALDEPLRVNSPLGKDVADYDAFYQSARNLMYSPAVDTAFKFSTTDAARYGTSAFGNACLVAKQLLAANSGTRFIQINYGNWDMHNDIYETAVGQNLPTLTKALDNGYAALIDDLKSTGLLRDTLVVMVGEFGRTVGRLNSSNGRDHYLQQFAVFAGGGVRGGRVLGQTNADGSDVTDFGWSRQRYIRPEDVEASIYSALGINWTNIRYDDPFGRGFEYVPFSENDLYGPINELWA